MAKRSFLSDPASDGVTLNGGSNGDVSGSRTLIERAYAQLRDDIVEGRLTPGDKLRVMPDLALVHLFGPDGNRLAA